MLTGGVMLDLRIPRTDVNVMEKLGQGGSGVVFKAMWKTKQQIVAVKQVLCFDPELSVLQSLRHKHIISFLGAIHEDQFMGIVMEFAEKGSLHQYLSFNEINFEQMLLWARHMALGVNYLHNEAPQKMIHRDLKSRNVVICSDMRAKICDFGCSKPLDNSTRVSVQGTYAWMAPEIMKNIRVSEKCDTYSFAVVLWELITGESPFKNFDSHQIIFTVCQYQKRMPIPETCPEKFAKLITDCWEQEASLRPDFKVILHRLNEMLCNEELSTEAQVFLEEKKTWKEELDLQIERIKNLKQEYQKKELELQQKLEEKDNKIKQLSYREKKEKPDEKGVKGWSEVEVIQWLNYMVEDPQQDYSEVFLNNHITGPRLIELREEDLVNMNITSVGHRKDILLWIKDLVAHFVVMENFPPLQPSPPKTERDKKNSELDPGTKLRLTLILGNHCIIDTQSKWLLYAMFEGDEIVVNSVLRVEFTLPEETIKIKKSPFVMNTWVSGEPASPVKCSVFYKKKVLKPSISTHIIDIKLQPGGVSQQHIIDVWLDLESVSVASLSSSHASSLTSLSLDQWPGLNFNSPGQGAWANGPPAIIQKSPLLFTPLKAMLPPGAESRRGSSPLTSPNFSPQVPRKSSSPRIWAPILNHSASSPGKINQMPLNLKPRPKPQISSDPVQEPKLIPVNDPYHPRFTSIRPKSQDSFGNKPLITDSLTSNMMNLGFSSGSGSGYEDKDTFILDQPGTKTFDSIRKTVADQIPQRTRGVSVCSTISNNSNDSVIEVNKNMPKKNKSNQKNTLDFLEDSSSDESSEFLLPNNKNSTPSEQTNNNYNAVVDLIVQKDPTPPPSYASSTASTYSNPASFTDNAKPSYAEILGVKKAPISAPSPPVQELKTEMSDKSARRERKSSGSSNGSSRGRRKGDYYRGRGKRLLGTSRGRTVNK